MGSHRLAWSRTLGSHPSNPGSNPGGTTKGAFPYEILRDKVINLGSPRDELGVPRVNPVANPGGTTSTKLIGFSEVIWWAA